MHFFVFGICTQLELKRTVLSAKAALAFLFSYVNRYLVTSL